MTFPIRARFVPRVFLALGIALAGPVPAAAVDDLPLAPNPIVVGVLEAMSVDTFAANVRTLQGFFTRNTVSDTLSDTTGNGAARRWIHDRFAAFAADAGGALVPDYFDFEETICGAPGVYRNVIGMLPGRVNPDRWLVVGAHFDSRGRDVCDPVEFAPAANDNGSGVAAVLEMARVMAGVPFDNGILFMAFTGEEQGLFGSKAYAAWADSAGLDIRAMINLDTISNVVDNFGRTDSTSFRVFSRGPTGSPHRQLMRLATRIGALYVPELEGLIQNREDRFGRGGDHISFGAHGFTAVRFIETAENGNEQHGDQDIFENMNPSYGIRVARAAAATVANLALAPARPAAPRFGMHRDGTMTLRWRRTNDEADLAGYLVALRALPPGGLFQDETNFKRIIDAGDVNEITIERPAEIPRFGISVAAYDEAGAISLFSDEVIALADRDAAPGPETP